MIQTQNNLDGAQNQTTSIELKVFSTGKAGEQRMSCTPVSLWAQSCHEGWALLQTTQESWQNIMERH